MDILEFYVVCCINPREASKYTHLGGSLPSEATTPHTRPTTSSIRAQRIALQSLISLPTVNTCCDRNRSRVAIDSFSIFPHLDFAHKLHGSCLFILCVSVTRGISARHDRFLFLCKSVNDLCEISLIENYFDPKEIFSAVFPSKDQ